MVRMGWMIHAWSCGQKHSAVDRICTLNNLALDILQATLGSMRNIVGGFADAMRRRFNGAYAYRGSRSHHPCLQDRKFTGQSDDRPRMTDIASVSTDHHRVRLGALLVLGGEYRCVSFRIWDEVPDAVCISLYRPQDRGVCGQLVQEWDIAVARRGNSVNIRLSLDSCG